MVDADLANLPPKLYFRIGEVAELVGVEPHVLRYWEREFRAIRPAKSAKGQRVYSRSDVQNLMRVRELLYKEGFTIAGAKKKMLQRAAASARPLDGSMPAIGSQAPAPGDALEINAPGPPRPDAPATEAPAADDAVRRTGEAAAPIDVSAANPDGSELVDGPSQRARGPGPSHAPGDTNVPMVNTLTAANQIRDTRLRDELLVMRAHIEAFLAEIEPPSPVGAHASSDEGLADRAYARANK
ncbi:MAG: MerR family transcriptional regulator [Polyangiaceae bacterium]|jgi:DNA-binding transcriptional MerR regulator